MRENVKRPVSSTLKSQLQLCQPTLEFLLTRMCKMSKGQMFSHLFSSQELITLVPKLEHKIHT